DALQRTSFFRAERPQAVFARHQEQDTADQFRWLAHTLRPSRGTSAGATGELAASSERRGLFALYPRLLAEDAGDRWLVDAARGAEDELIPGNPHERPAMNRMIFTALSAFAVTASAWAQTPAAKPDERTLSDAYVYLLGRTLVIRQEHMDRRGAG